MGDHEGKHRRVDGSAWLLRALGWTVGGMLAYLLVVGSVSALLRTGSMGDALRDGFGLAGFGLVCGFFVWVPLYVAAVASGWLALCATRRVPPDRDAARRLVFAVATAAGSGMFLFFGYLWLWTGGDLGAKSSLLLEVVAPTAVIAGVSAWCYYPRERQQGSFDRAEEPRWERPKTFQEYFAEPPAPPSPPGSSASDV
ncbi:hypothetical protein [Segniliparus rugosus]|uniref:Uncharacterized protein n=1 Tax=Segniliparus rugosus (strain ATCC BAA-974 / DSM 45345 / CCUG 50838 / CIP 108380 / JCM 13579 / CDC 945) TaxID=679197 RepID=E5XPQ2_SEGRC|nr:hypothetical protein [Segniliparus rugosus]EFV13650.2 hypothetical protein HMPREF9336_01474 [Segniliparus rugosus ATCC BAA-974]